METRNGGVGPQGLARTRPRAPGTFVDVDGLRIHVERRGNRGPPVVLLHGYLGSTATWYPALEHLGDQVRAVAVDLPGHGYSSKPLDGVYTLPWYAALLPRLWRALDVDAPVVLAHSFGAAVAMHALAGNPSLARGLVMVSPMVAGDAAPPGLRVARAFPRFMRRVFGSKLGRAAMPVLVRRAGFTRRDIHCPLRARRLLWNLDTPGGWEAATAVGLNAFAHAPGPAMWRQVNTPVLMFWGEQDPIHPPGVGAEVCRNLAGPSRLVVLPAASHNCHDEAAPAFSAHVLDWIKQLGRSV
jgi:pimeloyl-ACP methyl ester carboxylesterase